MFLRNATICILFKLVEETLCPCGGFLIGHRREVREECSGHPFHLFEVNAAAAISIIKSKSPSQLLIVGSLPANTNRQQPFPEADFAVLVGVQRIEYKLLHLFGLPDFSKKGFGI